MLYGSKLIQIEKSIDKRRTEAYIENDQSLVQQDIEALFEQEFALLLIKVFH